MLRRDERSCDLPTKGIVGRSERRGISRRFMSVQETAGIQRGAIHGTRRTVEGDVSSHLQGR